MPIGTTRARGRSLGDPACVRVDGLESEISQEAEVQTGVLCGTERGWVCFVAGDRRSGGRVEEWLFSTT
jgi:hypothetical protein